MEETEIPSESHVRFFTDHSRESYDVTALNSRAISPRADSQWSVRQTCIDSLMRFVLSVPLDVDAEVVLAKRGKLKAEEDRKSPVPAVTTKKAGTDNFTAEYLEINPAPKHTTNTAGTSARHTTNNCGSGEGGRTL